MWNTSDNSLAELPDSEIQQVTATLAAGPRGADSHIALLIAQAKGIDRSQKRLIERARQVGGLLAKDGFYRFPAGDKSIEGPSIDLAEALAQEWGAIAYEVEILSTENLSSGGRKVHFRARVTDFKTLVMASVENSVTTSAPPGKFANKDEQRERWHSMQVGSAASKIARNAMLRVLPNWYVQPAFRAAMDADAKSAVDGKSLPEARATASKYLAGFGLSPKELEEVTGQPFEMWAAPQLATLRDLAEELRTSRVSVEQVRASLVEAAAPTDATQGKGSLGLGGRKPKAAAVPEAAAPPVAVSASE